LSSIERTAYPRFPRLISARELHVFYTPASEEITWAGEVTNSDESLLGLVLALKCFQRMGRFPRDEEIPELVVDHVRRGLGLDAGVSAVYGSDRTRRHHLGWSGNGSVWSITRRGPARSPLGRSGRRR
jgi:Domain of unknown function (DUF4158)